MAASILVVVVARPPIAGFALPNGPFNGCPPTAFGGTLANGSGSPSWGGSLNGYLPKADGANLTVRSNYNGSSCARPWNSSDGTDHWHLQFQCTELAVRVMDVEANEGGSATWYNAGWNGAAWNIFNVAGSLSVPLAVLTNAATTSLPQLGDLVVFDGTSSDSTGHVAVVEGVAGGRVYFVGQNQGAAEASIPYSIGGGGAVIVNGSSYIGGTPLHGSYEVRGWVRANATPPPPPGALQITTAPRPPALGALTDVFTRGTNGHAWHAVTQLNGTTSAWEDLQGNLAGEPAAMWNSAGTELDVYAIGTDNHVWHDQYFTSSGTWTGWGSSPWPGSGTAYVSTTENITVTPRPGGGMDLLMMGADGGGWLAVAYADGTYWTGWYSLQGHLLGAPTGSFSTDGTEFDAFAIGTDNQVWVDRYDAACGNWFCGFQAMGGRSAVAEDEMVASVREPNNSVDLEVRGTDNAAWLFNTSPPFNPGNWSTMYGTIVGTPNMDWVDSTHLTSYAVAPNDTLWWTIWSSGPNPWQALPAVSLPGGLAG